MKQENLGTGHGMTAPVSPEVKKRIAEQEAAKRKKQAEDFAKNSLPNADTRTVTIHESKNFPFMIVEETESNENKTETNFMIGLAGKLLSEKKFKTMKSAEMYISRKPWDLIMGFVCTTIELMKKDNEESK